MNQIKKFLFIFLLLISSLKQSSILSNEEKLNKQKINYSKDGKKDDFEMLNELREKSNNITEEGNNLKIKKEIYNIYIYLLLSLNIIFALILFSYSIYRIYYCSKKKQIKNINLNESILSNNTNENEQLESEENKEKINIFNSINSMVDNKQIASLNEDSLNKSGLEAPAVDKYYINTNH